MKPSSSTPLRRSAFKHWFREQYGVLPNERRRYLARKKISDLERALHVARTELQVEDARFAAFTNALYGWNARVK